MIIQKDILSFTSTDLSTQLASLGWEKYRIKQLNNWLWKHCVRDFNQMTNLSVKQREELTNLFTINSLREDKKQISNDGTIKVWDEMLNPTGVDLFFLRHRQDGFS